jgi:hypothetical protein
LNNHRDIIVTSTLTTFSEDWTNLDNRWTIHFLSVGKDHPDFKDKVRFFYFVFILQRRITPG